MNAVIMAGGEGSRLRPLTCDIPKPLIPLCGKPVLEYIIDLLRKHSCEKAVMTLMYLGSNIVSHFEKKEYTDIEIAHSFEDTPLGTAGSVKKAARGFEDDFVVISGDAMCDFDLTAAINFHRSKGAEATLIVKRVSDPREYGLVNTDGGGRITGFLEKPSIANCITNLANTGIYILSPKVLDCIEDKKKVDFAQHVFPKLLEINRSLYAYEDDGYWCDIGDFKTLLQCQRDMLAHKVKCKIDGVMKNGIYWGDDGICGDFFVSAPAYIGKNVTIGSGTKIRAGSVIGDNSVIGAECRIRASMLMDCVNVSDNVRCTDAIVCKNSRLLKNSGVFEGGVLGTNSVLGADASVASGVRVWPGKTVPNGIMLTENLQYGETPETMCGEDGICGEANLSITPELCVKIGAGMASLIPNAVVGVGYTPSRMGKSLA
ncbi:MAG: sugar phosphate nucleotidyltransferase, partial [Oscillospiraceae bacterium]|nr:sugar phosphate nucleotidyltransferase [Oscillospiraceae bacterium]